MTRPERVLQAEVVASSRRSLERGERRRRAVSTPDEARAWRDDVRRTVSERFPDAVFDRDEHVDVNHVSSHECDGYRVENVVFESLEGWEVNASVYCPPDTGRYPGVVCPSGHSAKTNPPYQRPPQVFARNGYVAVAFDAPGRGEKTEGNDHFRDGVVGYLTGFWSGAYFVVDALRCLDYLQQRDDVDSDRLAVTGVSGGGTTSLFVGLLDDRVDLVAPVCFGSELLSTFSRNPYTACPEVFGPGLVAAGLDWADYVGALAPTPCLIAAGKHDAVHGVDSVRNVRDGARPVYGALDREDRLDLFVDPDAGHDYTVSMANEVVRWLNEYVAASDEPPRSLTADDVSLLEPGRLQCDPSDATSMASNNRALAHRLRDRRDRPADDPVEDLRSASERVLGVSAPVRPVRARPRSEPRESWNALVEEVAIYSTEHVPLPGVMASHVENDDPRPGVVWVDGSGRWEPLRQSGYLTGPLRPFEADCADTEPRLLSLDVSGLGRLAPEPAAYDLASWNDVRRALTYLSIADGRPIAGLRVRDALAGLDYVAGRADVDTDRLAIGGRGTGAIVALLGAALSPRVQRVVAFEPLSRFEALAETPSNDWPHSIVVPEVLEHFDLPELVAALAPETDVRIVNPLDADRERFDRSAAATLYSAGIEAGATVDCAADGEAAVADAVGATW